VTREESEAERGDTRNGAGGVWPHRDIRPVPIADREDRCGSRDQRTRRSRLVKVADKTRDPRD
jgi:hypothetical protein